MPCFQHPRRSPGNRYGAVSGEPSRESVNRAEVQRNGKRFLHLKERAGHSSPTLSSQPSAVEILLFIALPIAPKINRVSPSVCFSLGRGVFLRGIDHLLSCSFALFLC